jgi:hypothetical protein
VPLHYSPKRGFTAMPIRFDRRKLSESRQGSWFVLDLAMIVLVLINLIWIVFDTLYGAPAIQAFFARQLPRFNTFYRDEIHVNFVFYDLIFVAIFLSEFVFQWAMAVRRQVYPRWYFFPFARWYDLLGSIPIGSLRLLRLLRVFSLLYRLQKMSVIDLTETRFYQFLLFYYNAFIDEVTDRVQLRVLDDVKREVEHDNPIARQIITEVVAPRRNLLVEHLSRRMGDIAKRSYENNRAVIRDYVESLIAAAVASNAELRTLERVPLLGHAVVSTLRHSINDIAYHVFDRAARDLSSADNNRLVDEMINVVLDVLLEKHPELGDIGTRMTVDAIELVKDRIRVQHWREALTGAEVRAPAT